MRISISGSFAASSHNAFAEMRIPGAVTPDTNAPSLSTRSYVVAVPKSRTSTGPPYSSYAAAASTIRSAPIWRGFSVTTRIPVLVPGSTIIGRMLKYLIIAPSRECITFGTTDAIIASSISSCEIEFCSSRLLNSIPYSSDVRGIFVVIRKFDTTSSPRNTPTVIFVFPTSIVIIIVRTPYIPTYKTL